MKQKSLSLAICLSLIILILGGYYLRNLKKQNPTSEPSVEFPVLNTSNWKTYDSTLFSFQYPPEFLIDNTRNAILTWGPTIDVTSQFFGETDHATKVGPSTTAILDGKKASMRDLSYEYLYTNPRKDSFVDKIRQVSIENVPFYRDNKWTDKGVLYLDIHVDGDNPNAASIVNSILNSLKIRDIDSSTEMLTVKMNKLEFQLPKTWWYRCVDNLCSIDMAGNTQPKRPSHFYIQFFPKDEVVYPMIEEKLLKNKKTQKITISGVDGLQMNGIIDPKKYTEGSAWYFQNSSISFIQFETKEGTYIFSSVTTEKETKKGFSQILSTFRFTQ